MTANDSPDITHDDARDAELIRYLDGELTADERISLEAALAVDTERAARLATLRRRSRRMRALLAGADPDADEVTAADPTRTDGVQSIEAARRARAQDPASRPPVVVGPTLTSQRAPATRRAWLRAAIILFVLAAGAMAVPPLRAWVVDAVQRIVSGEPEPVAPGEVVPEPTGQGNEFAVARIPVNGPTFTIEMEAVQSGGTLTLRLADGATASAAVTDAGTEGVLALPGGVRIQNAATSTANYTFTLPRSVTRVILRAPGSADRTISLDAATSQRVIPLGR